MGLTGAHLRDGGYFEMGYWLGRPYWGQGYATEAARKLAAFAFSGLKAGRLTAGYFHDNPASGRVLEKIGFKPDGAEHRDCLARGHTVYCLGMLLQRENFGRRPDGKSQS
jgi:RimJ/RimL family protein N-acetyltransferase